MEIIYKKIDEIKPYEKNPRKNDKAVDLVANSIKEFGFKVPIIIDKNNVIVTGHTRYKASKKLKLEEVPCLMADDLTEEQIKAFRLADNKVSEKSEWDDILLNEELEGILNLNMEDFGFLLNEDEEESKYTKKVEIPHYEIKGDMPLLSELYKEEKVQELLNKIDNSDVEENQKDFLRKAATRHYQFNYSKIAEYYANQDKKMQELMEESALVLIDFDNAIANGYVKLSKDMEDLFNNE